MLRIRARVFPNAAFSLSMRLVCLYVLVYERERGGVGGGGGTMTMIKIQKLQKTITY